ncbi:MAG: transpeptidase family protein [Prevotellaceae bacterium]|jgi:cell division protein FtsI (penicillin-binding protein 3)|nr:transpeptidase family protein [Prevotellaceae bacterium]
MPKKKQIILTYFVIALLVGGFGIGILVQAGTIMYDRPYWETVQQKLSKDSLSITPERGNIFSADGQLMAASVPAYKLYIDCRAQGLDRQLFQDSLNVICKGLHQIIPQWSTNQFKQHLQKGMKSGSRYYAIYPKRISYLQYKQVKELPVLGLKPNEGGVLADWKNERVKPFGSLAARTLGDVYGDMALGGSSGVEYAYNQDLKGISGVKRQMRIRGAWVDEEVIAPTRGKDIITTLDVDMQDICEKILTDKLVEIDADEGVVVLMEVKTGDIKAMVNLGRSGKGTYTETRNMAISNMMEPGSTFKTASLMVALEDGKITPANGVNVGNGLREMYGRIMRDHNANRGGYQAFLPVKEILKKSSNVGTSVLIDEVYHNQPQAFVDGLYRMGLATPIDLKIGKTNPVIKTPKSREWYKTTLPWMSIGYETQIPPLQLLAFYNAIANDGCMVKPRLVQAIRSEEETVEFPTEVMVKKICSDRTLATIREMLGAVVNEHGGLGAAAASKRFPIAGKTGTAQVAVNGRYMGKNGERYHLVSFCGFYPADKPEYTCIVSIRISKGTPSGGLMAGSTFGHIAERIMAKTDRRPVREAVDSITNLVPTYLAGAKKPVEFVFKELGIQGKPYMIDALVSEENTEPRVPNVIGMSARDAVYLLERKGMKVRVGGVGKVTAQSIAEGDTCKGQYISLQLK